MLLNSTLAHGVLKKITYLFIEVLFFYQLFNNFPALLLCSVNCLDIFNMADFLIIFVASWNIKILTDI